MQTLKPTYSRHTAPGHFCLWFSWSAHPNWQKWQGPLKKLKNKLDRFTCQLNLSQLNLSLLNLFRHNLFRFNISRLTYLKKYWIGIFGGKKFFAVKKASAEKKIILAERSALAEKGYFFGKGHFLRKKMPRKIIYLIDNGHILEAVQKICTRDQLFPGPPMSLMGSDPPMSRVQLEHCRKFKKII